MTLPFWTRSGEYDFDAGAPPGLTLPPVCLLLAGICAAETARLKNNPTDKSARQYHVERGKFISVGSVVIACWPRMRTRTSLSHTQYPLDRFKVHFADVGVVPSLLGVAEGRIEHSPFAVHFVPRHGEIMVRSVDARVVRIVKLCGVKTE